MTALAAHGAQDEASLPNGLAAKVTAELRQIYVRPISPPSSFSVPPGEVGALAKSTLDTMLVRAFRVGTLPSDEDYAELLARVRHWVARGEAIRIMIGYAPMKNPKSAGHTHADWAEFFALAHLVAWHNKVAAVYPPGLRIKIIFDDSTIRMANRYGWGPMKDYMGSVARLVRAMGYESCIVGTMRQSSFAWLFHFGLYQLAGLRVRRWERDPANHEMFEQMLEGARRNLATPDDWSAERREQYCRDAAHRYRVYWEALQMSGLSRLGKKLVAMYLDGNQHHLRQSAALHLTSVAKGQVTQPWQGEGVLRDNGHDKLVPIVLSGKRRDEVRLQRVDVPGVVSHPGLDAIFVCYDRSSASSSSSEAKPENCN
jgi:pyoverdine/dityrosine biosynthesis protein